ncbi:PREDICTED: uncharacterized protein LOC109166928 [Ipomoea nil]|uniref:uncharacterized protein LOC109166928 n=1 Tax=Ipomoea nil TaxID=35883 RepID=UPI000900D666|nr:PREDICTED: uncharacterized protein LOC109166928 [Ipomoea nil]
MVSEPPRPTSYVAAVAGTGESSQKTHPSAPVNRSPINTSPPNRSLNLTPQRSNISEDIENPLHLNSNESSNAILVIPPLTESNNYGTWSISMRVALEVKNKWGIVDGSITPSDRSSNQYAGNLTVNEYYTKCRILWEQMNELRPIAVCKCDPRCSCNLLDEIRSEREVDQTPQIVTNDIVAAFNQFNNRKNMNSGNGGNKAKCTFCGMSAHTIEKCYKKHGYLPGWIPGYKSKERQQTIAASTSRDAGATDHIVCSLGLFDDYYAVEGTRCQLQGKLGKMIGFAKEQKGLYLLLKPPIDHSMSCTHFAMSCSAETWHRGLGHFPINKMHRLNDISMSSTKNLICDTYHFAKHKRAPFPLSTTMSKVCFELIHVDIWGPFMVQSLGGERYFLTIVDDYSRYTWLHLMRHKSETQNLIRKFHKYVHTQFGLPIKIIRSDNGPEFNMVNFFDDNGIIHQRTCMYTPQQNAVVERKHQHVLTVAKAL